MERFKIGDEAGLDEVAGRILELYPNKRIFALEGEMGAGKTTLIKYFCKKLKVEDVVASPTFAIVYEYLSGSGPVYHFDFYRINKLEEVVDLGYEDYVYSGSYCFMEWPEKIEQLLPHDFVYIRIIMGPEKGQRVITTEEIKR
jgi:tRNA threonylcarbamoyladenosine biosynthesis protein TsaE